MDFLALMRAHLDASREGDYHLGAVAAEFCSQMQEQHAEEWSAWLVSHAPVMVRREMGSMESSRRATARHRAKARAFGEAVDTGDPQSYFLSTAYVVSDDNTRRTMAEMTGADHGYVASRYERTGKAALMAAAFHRALSKRLGDRTTAEVFTESQIAALWKNFDK